MIRLALLLALLPTSLFAEPLTLIGRFIWEEPMEEFGGLSGIETLDGQRFIAISDRGYFFEGSLVRVDGELVGATLDSHLPIPDSKGNALSGYHTNAEGLDIDPNGQILISFEANHRIMKHESTTAAGEFIPKHPDFDNLQNNSGLEALATDANGTIYAIPERSGKIDRPFPVYRFDGENWDKELSIPRSGEYLVVGADFGPDGRLYILERGFTWKGGFFTRIRSFELSGNDLGKEQILLESPPGRLGNTEGISVWIDNEGQTRITIVADDNFNPLQNTTLIEYVLESSSSGSD